MSLRLIVVLGFTFLTISSVRCDETSGTTQSKSHELVLKIRSGFDDTPREVFRVASPDGFIKDCCLSADGKSVVLLTSDGCFFKSQAGEMRKIIRKPGKYERIRLSEDGSRFVLWNSRRLEVFETDSGQSVCELVPREGARRFVAMSASGNRNFLAVIDDKSKLSVVNLVEGTGRSYPGDSQQKISRAAVAIANDGKRVYTVVQDGEIVLTEFNEDGTVSVATPWSVKSASPRHKMNAGDTCFGAFNKYEMYLMRRDADNTMRVIPNFGSALVRTAQIVKRDGHEFIVSIASNTHDERVKLCSEAIDHKPQSSPTWFFPKDASDLWLDKTTWDATGQRVAFVTGREIFVYECPPFLLDWGYQVFRPLARDLIGEQEYAVLDEITAQLLEPSDFVPRPISHWIEFLENHAFNDAEDPESDQPDQFLLDWLEKYPNSPSATYFVAAWQMRKAWRMRGDSFADKLDDSQILGFETHVAEAHSVLGDDPGNDALPHSIALAIDLAKARGISAAEKQALFERLRRDHPNFELGHYRAIECLLVRWGGSPGEVEQYMRDAADFVGGDAGDRLYAHMTLHLTQFFPMPDFFDRVKLDRDRVVRGMLKTNVGRNTNLSGYMNMIVWHVMNDQFVDAYRLCRYFDDHDTWYASPLNRNNQPYAIARMLSSRPEVIQYLKELSATQESK